MTTEEILKLAEFDPWDLECDVGNRLFKVDGAKWQHARLLPLIKALAESNEKLVKALAKCESFLNDDIAKIPQEWSVPQMTEEQWENAMFHRDLLSKALAAHNERMKGLEKP